MIRRIFFWLAGHVLHGERDRRHRQAYDRVHSLDLEPAPRRLRRAVGLVQGVRLHDLDRLAESRAARVPHRHLDRGDHTRPT